MALTPKRITQRPRLSAEQSREALLDSAANEVAQAGAPLDLIEFSMEGIIENASVSRSAAYSLFGGSTGFRQAIIQRIAERDPYSQGDVDVVIGEIVEEAQQGEMERSTAVARVGLGLAAVAFSPIALNLERIVELKNPNGKFFYIEAAHTLHQQQAALHHRLRLHLPVLHLPYGETPIDEHGYARDLLAAARSHAAFPLSDAADRATFNAITDVHVVPNRD